MAEERRYNTTPPPGADESAELQHYKDQVALLRTALDTIVVAAFDTDLEGTVIYMNPLAEEMFCIDCKSARAVRMNLFEYFVISDPALARKNIIDLLHRSQIVKQRAIVIPPSGKRAIVEFSASFLEVEDAPRRIMCTCRDITLEVEQRQELERLARTDTLTGCHNRLWFNEKLVEITKRVAQSDESVGLIFLDLDRFKTYNDAAGQLKGDALIQRVIKTMQIALSRRGEIARVGGDEFVVIIESVSSEGFVIALAHELLDAVQGIEEELPSGKTYRASASLGVAVLAGKSSKLTDLLSLAESAKRLAKERGRGQVCFLHQPPN